MTRSEFYATLDDILELPPGTIKGPEKLDTFQTWDSLAVVNYIATCNGLFGVVIEGDPVKSCIHVEDLVKLVYTHIKD